MAWMRTAWSIELQDIIKPEYILIFNEAGEKIAGIYDINEKRNMMCKKCVMDVVLGINIVNQVRKCI